MTQDLRTQTQRAVRKVQATCPNCKAVNDLENCVKQYKRDNGLEEGGMECPDCGHWTHSFWMDAALTERRERLEQIRLMHQATPTEGRWRNYQTALNAYKRDFEKVQVKYAKKGGNTG